MAHSVKSKVQNFEFEIHLRLVNKLGTLNIELYRAASCLLPPHSMPYALYPMPP
jgi:hypothetical protein